MVAVINGVWRKIFHWQSSGIFPPGDELWLQLPPNPAEHKRAEQGREMAPTALIKLCQLKALYPLSLSSPFLPREIWNSKFSTSLALRDHGARARRCPTLSLFDQAIFNLSLKSLPLSPPSLPPRSVQWVSFTCLRWLKSLHDLENVTNHTV